MNRPNTPPTRPPSVLQAFTLIELLIVVAIIAILAAIAVPNFLEAQVRSKVSRTKADMRSLAVAVEAYAVDNNRYPTPANENLVTEITPATEPWENRTPPLLTTPIAYITSLLHDVFASKDPITNETPVLHYSNRDYFQAYDAVTAAGTETQFNAYVTQLAHLNPASVEYFMQSHGPDLDHDDPDAGTPALYDPTNGTNSNGDILYYGPGSGFRN